MAESLGRFVAAQDAVWTAVRAELSAGKKRSHWMWFVFPQIAGLGRSAMSARYELDGLSEATAYLEHATLGPRLRDCVALMLKHKGQSAEAILGGIDALKFGSCLTLFQAAAPDDPVYTAALAAFYAGTPDARTIALLAKA